MHFAASSNGDRWFLGTDNVTKKDFVLHRGNPSSGGHETISAVEVFLNTRPFGPERDALLAMLAVRDDQNAPDSSAVPEQ
jgi:hypothetical protein